MEEEEEEYLYLRHEIEVILDHLSVDQLSYVFEIIRNIDDLVTDTEEIARKDERKKNYTNFYKLLYKRNSLKSDNESTENVSEIDCEDEEDI